MLLVLRGDAKTKDSLIGARSEGIAGQMLENTPKSIFDLYGSWEALDSAARIVFDVALATHFKCVCFGHLLKLSPPPQQLSFAPRLDGALEDFKVCSEHAFHIFA